MKQCPLLKCKHLFLEEEGITSHFIDHFQLCQQTLRLSAHKALRRKEHQDRKETGSHTEVRGTVDNLQLLLQLQDYSPGPADPPLSWQEHHTLPKSNGLKYQKRGHMLDKGYDISKQHLSFQFYSQFTGA